MTTAVPFSRLERWGEEEAYVLAALRGGRWGAGGVDSAWCASWLRARTGSREVLMTPSCTDALELALLVAGVGPGDEVIVPSWTFVSTANAIVLRGATPVWADVDARTLNLDPEAAAAAVTPRTRAVVVVHYGGVAADMERLARVAAEHDLMVVEDAAHGLLAGREGRALGAIAPIGCLSFDAQKNVSCGEGGAVLVSDPDLVDAAVIAADKGTNRAQHLRGEAPSYEWVAAGSSWGLAGLSAALLRAQLEHAEGVTQRRLSIWDRYYEGLLPLHQEGLLRLPEVPAEAAHNAHIFWIQVDGGAQRDDLLGHMRQDGIDARFHFVPLHTTPAGARYGRPGGDLAVTEAAGAGVIRLPLWAGMDSSAVESVVGSVREWARGRLSSRLRRGRAGPSS